MLHARLIYANEYSYLLSYVHGCLLRILSPVVEQAHAVDDNLSIDSINYVSGGCDYLILVLLCTYFSFFVCVRF